MAYGLLVKSNFNTTLFNSNDVGKPLVVKSRETVNENTGVTTEDNDVLLFRLGASVQSGHAFWVYTETSFTGIFGNVEFTTKFHIERTAGSSQNITTIDIIRLRTIDNITIQENTQTYGLKVRGPAAYNPVIFDSRQYSDFTDFDINNTDSSALNHGGLLKSYDSETYFCANPLDFTNITNFVRKYGLLFSNTTGTAFNVAFPNNITGTGIRACNELNQGPGGKSYPASLQPYFWGSDRTDND